MTDGAPGVQTPRALVLDVDGTLLDTVYLHVMAWWEAFRDAGHRVSCVDVHRAIGLPSADLVAALLGGPDEAVVAGHDERWKPLRERCDPFHRVPDLLRLVASRGVRVVYCTSGSPEDVADFREKIGVDDVVAAAVGTDEVERGKPAPDIVQLALREVGVAPRDAVMVGDTTYDVRAARAAGVACIGLLCGGIGERELQDAGAAAVYANPSHLLQELERSPVGRLLDSVQKA